MATKVQGATDTASDHLVNPSSHIMSLNPLYHNKQSFCHVYVKSYLHFYLTSQLEAQLSSVLTREVIVITVLRVKSKHDH